MPMAWGTGSSTADGVSRQPSSNTNDSPGPSHRGKRRVDTYRSAARFQELQDALRQEWADFSQTLDDRLEDHFHRQELLLNTQMNAQALRIEGIVCNTLSTVSPSCTGKGSATPVDEQVGQTCQSCIGAASPDDLFFPKLEDLAEVDEIQSKSESPQQLANSVSDKTPENHKTPENPEQERPRPEQEEPHPGQGRNRLPTAETTRLETVAKVCGFNMIEEPANDGTPRASYGSYGLNLSSETSREQYLGKIASTYIESWVEWWEDLDEPLREGTLADMVNSKTFELIAAVVIACNSVLTVHTTNYEAKTHMVDDSIAVRILNIGFAAFYSVELGMRLWVHRFFFFCNTDMTWNVFDLGLVALAVYDIIMKEILNTATEEPLNVSHMRSMRILRVAKILRVFRVMKIFQELRLMLNSVLGSIVSLFWSIVMLILMFFMFSLVFVQGATNTLVDKNIVLSAEDADKLETSLGSIQSAMLTLYEATTGGDDWVTIFKPVAQTGTINVILFLFFVAFSQIALLNILTGIYVENAMKLAQPDRDTRALQKRKEEQVEAAELRFLVKTMDPEGTGQISRAQFMSRLQNEQFKAKLSVLGLDIKDAELFFHIVSSDFEHKEIDVEAFVSGAMRLKGNASALDLQTLSFGTKLIHANQIKFHRSLDKRMGEVLSHLSTREAGPV